MIMISQKELEFLFESNNIEGELDAISLMQAVHAWQFMKEQKFMTVGAVLKTHKILMLNAKLYPNEKGYFRTIDIYIGGKRKKFIHESKLREDLQHLLDRMNDPDRDEPKINGAWSRTAHVEFEDIHPFVDGNGRVGRMLYNWHRLKMGLEIDVIHEGAEQKLYYKWFK